MGSYEGCPSLFMSGIHRLGFERKARLFCDFLLFFWQDQNFLCWDLSGRLGYFVTIIWLRIINCILSFVVCVGIWAEGSVILWRLEHFVVYSDIYQLESWDLSGRLGYFVTGAIFSSNKKEYKLGFERKARLFCDNYALMNSPLCQKFKCWDLSGRLGYFVTIYS